jgi:hypothetical protein
MHPPHGKAVVEAPVAVMRIEPSWTKFGGCINHVMGLLYGTYIYILYSIHVYSHQYNGLRTWKSGIIEAYCPNFWNKDCKWFKCILMKEIMMNQSILRQT